MDSSLVGLFLTDDMSEFKSASELDDTTIKSIRNEYLKKTLVLPFILVVVLAAVIVLLILQVIPAVFGPSDIYDTVYPIMGGLCGALTIPLISNCIFSLVIASKIKKKKFLWYTGFIRGKNWRYPAKVSYMHKYYSVDEKYFALISLNPVYKKRTPVYFLYFPGLSEHFSIGGIVVKYEL